MAFTAQIPHRIESENQTRKMKCPVIIRHRREKATIYGKSPGYDFYRLGYYVAGQRRVHREDFVCNALIGCTFMARRIVAGAASDSPR